MRFEIFLYILAMAVVTYLMRMLPFTFLKKKIRSRYLRSFLYYIPYAVLASMVIPAIFYATGNVWMGAAAFAVAVIVSFCGQSLLVVALAAAVAAYLATFLPFWF